jgi:hypothetical protein
MESSEILMIAGVAIIIQCAIVYYLVRAAVSDATKKHNIAIIKLLALTAQKNGADPNFVDTIVMDSDPAFRHDIHFKRPAPKW